MSFTQDMLIKLFSEYSMTISITGLEPERIAEIALSRATKALTKIQTILANDAFSDFDCIEAIVRVMEELGSDGGSRHDF